MSYPPYPGASEPTGTYGPPPAYYPAPWPTPAPTRGLATAAVWIAVLFALFEVVEAGLAWQAQGKFLDAVDRGEVLPWTPYDFTFFGGFAVLIAAYVVTCLWLYRVRTNTDIMSTLRHARSPGWVWGGWVVPIVSLWFPYQIVRDVSRDERGFPVVSRIGTWWTLWLLSLSVERIGLRIVNVQSEVDPNAYEGLGIVETLNAVLVLVALFFWIRIIRGITAHQDRLMGITS